jgi:uncharacterized membrane protein YedE/YeeE
MKKEAAAYVSGFAFAIGLGVSGMTSPLKVLGFLDFAGRWDASLLFVMVAAVGVYAVGYRLVTRRSTPLVAGSFEVGRPLPITARYILGAVVFGIGWGIAGYCPGPAIVSIASGRAPAVVFTIGMVTGMAIHGALRRWRERTPMQQRLSPMA